MGRAVNYVHTWSLTQIENGASSRSFQVVAQVADTHQSHFSSVGLLHGDLRNYPLYSVFWRPARGARDRRGRAVSCRRCSADPRSSPGSDSATPASGAVAGGGGFWSKRFSAFFALFSRLLIKTLSICFVHVFHSSGFKLRALLRRSFHILLNLLNSLFTIFCHKIFTEFSRFLEFLFAQNFSPVKVLQLFSRFFRVLTQNWMITTKERRPTAWKVSTRMKRFDFCWARERNCLSVLVCGASLCGSIVCGHSKMLFSLARCDFLERKFYSGSCKIANNFSCWFYDFMRQKIKLVILNNSTKKAKVN